MNQQNSRFFMVREPTTAHGAFIRLAKRPSTDFEQIIDIVFSHQVACYKPAPALASDNSRAAQTALALTVAHHFYQNCYTEPKIRRGNEAGDTISLQTFVDRVILSQNPENRNHLSYLLGGVGVGKTAFINYLLSRFGRTWITANHIWFVRLDVEIAGDADRVSAEQLMDAIAQKCGRIVRDNREIICRPGSSSAELSVLAALEKLHKASERPYEAVPTSDRGQRFTHQVEAFTQLVAALKRDCGRQLFLVLDNIDYICHVCDRVLFEKDEDTQEFGIVECVSKLARLFFHDSHLLGRIGANILFVFRPDTYRIVSQAGRTSLPESSFWEDVNAYTLVAPEWEQVLYGRGKLLEFAASAARASASQGPSAHEKLIKTIVDDLLAAPHGQPKMVEHLLKLTNHGLRQIVQFFQQYSWVSGNNDANTSRPMGRFAAQYPVAMLAFMLGGRRRFSQIESSFPNIYLVNSQKQEHFHSYWLKYLIAELIFKTSERGEHLAAPIIIHIFSGHKKRCYEQSIVRECLGSLSDANSSDMLSVGRTTLDLRTLRIDKLALTLRGKHCLEQIFSKFYYLQLVVDDYLLPLPRIVADVFKHRENDDDYAYLVFSSHAEFHKAAARMITKKARQVLTFLLILELSLECERERYRIVFEELQFYGVAAFDVGVVREHVKKELRTLSSEVVSGLDVEAISLDVSKQRGDIEKYLRDAYFPDKRRLER